MLSPAKFDKSEYCKNSRNWHQLAQKRSVRPAGTAVIQLRLLRLSHLTQNQLHRPWGEEVLRQYTPTWQANNQKESGGIKKLSRLKKNEKEFFFFMLDSLGTSQKPFKRSSIMQCCLLLNHYCVENHSI